MTLKVRKIFQDNIQYIDADILDYFEAILAESITRADLRQTLGPFVESFGIAESKADIDMFCEKMATLLDGCGIKEEEDSEEPELLDKAIVLSKLSAGQFSKEEKAAVDNMWGFENVRKTRNTTMEFSEAASARYERKAAKEQRKWLDDLESQFVGEEDNNKVSTMMLPDYSGGSNEKDIHVHNFNITYGGSLLLEGADLKLVFGRKYGLIGRNGVGKTTLLKHMASFDIEGFPRHHRILHVKQEVKSSTDTVVQVILDSDIERNMLLAREKELIAKQESIAEGNTKELSKVLADMEELQERMEIIGVHTAEARAATILSGLQFTEDMQNTPTENLSGGWRMRVAIAAALFIEPDVLMLDEPTNHLDLEAVIWLEKYLRHYQKTIMLVSHDRAFVNDVCTDIILFDKLKLNYYRGNFDSYEATRKEMEVVQQKQHEAQQVKLLHMQEFVDKFRFNAKRASLVQSRIKAIEKETVIQAIEEEAKFSFEFFDAGQLGRPIIQIEGVTFGYPPSNPELPPVALFKNVHLNIDQSSRVALVGPNGAGKVSVFSSHISLANLSYFIAICSFLDDK